MYDEMPLRGAKSMRRGNREKIKHLIYSSKPAQFDKNVLKGILISSRKNNPEKRVTGSLICCSDFFIQFLEGPPRNIDILYDKILSDKRHTDIVKLREVNFDRRLFASWAMRFDNCEDWILENICVGEGYVKKIRPDDAFAIFEKLSREGDQFLDPP